MTDVCKLWDVGQRLCRRKTGAVEVCSGLKASGVGARSRAIFQGSVGRLKIARKRAPTREATRNKR